MLKNIIAKAGGGILPLGGSGELTSGYKGYGFAMLCEICTAILSGGTTSNYIYKTPGRANIAQCFIALDYGMFGDKQAIREALDRYLQEIRDSDKAEGQERIFIHGEKSAEARERVLDVYKRQAAYWRRCFILAVCRNVGKEAHRQCSCLLYTSRCV